MSEPCRLRRGEGYGACDDESRTPPRRAHDTLQPQDESIIVGYYTSVEVHPPKATRISTVLVGRERSSMARGDGIHRTSARNMRLTTPKLKNAQQHNEREKESYVNQDIVPERSHLNVHFKQPDSGYLEQFEQMEADGLISTRGIKEDAFRYGELIFDVNSAYFFNHGGYDFAKQFYHDAYQAAIKIVGGEQYILSAVMHADERNRAMSEALGQDVYHYHLHVVYVPVVEKQIRWSKRCKDKSLVGKVKETVMQVSLSKKWASKLVLDETTGEPLKTARGKPVLKKSYSVLQDDFFQYMREAGYADVERGERGSSEEHLTVTQFKVEREQARLAELQEVKSEVLTEIGQLQEDKAKAEKSTKEAQTELRLLAPKLKHMEKLAAEYSSNPEDLLPLPDRMESAKSYREEKSKPLLEKIVKVVRSVYRAYLDVCQKFELLQRKYDTEVPYLKKQLAEVRGENAELQETARDYHRLCRAYGPERVAETVAAIKQQEQAEKEQKRSQKRRHDRDAR